MSAISDRVRGGLVGVAVGDALGATLEFGPPRPPDRRHTEIIGGGPFNWEPGEPTDDTDLTLAVAEAYAEGFTVAGVADRFLAWYEFGPRDIGGTTTAGLAAYRAHRDPLSSGRSDEWSAANGSLMRTIAVGLARPDPNTRRLEAAAVSAITHAEPRCTSACIAYCEVVDALVRGASITGAIAAAAELADLHPGVLELLHRSRRLRLEDLDTSGHVLGTLGVALWAVCQPLSFEEALITVVNLGGDADTTGAVAGGLLGVRDGIDAIPQRWRRAILAGPRLEELADPLTRLRLEVSA